MAAMARVRLPAGFPMRSVNWSAGGSNGDGRTSAGRCPLLDGVTLVVSPSADERRPNAHAEYRPSASSDAPDRRVGARLSSGLRVVSRRGYGPTPERLSVCSCLGRPRGERPDLRDSLACAAEITGSCVGRRVNRVEVADGVTVALPLLLEDPVPARQGGLGVSGSPRALAGRGRVVWRDGGEESRAPWRCRRGTCW